MIHPNPNFRKPQVIGLNSNIQRNFVNRTTHHTPVFCNDYFQDLQNVYYPTNEFNDSSGNQDIYTDFPHTLGENYNEDLNNSFDNFNDY